MDPTEATTRIVEAIIEHHGAILIGPAPRAGGEGARAAAVGDAAGDLYQAVWHAVVHADDPDE